MVKKGLVLALILLARSAAAQNEIPNSQLTVQFVDSQEVGFESKLAIDNDPSTMWATEWVASHPTFPHEIIINLNGSSLLYSLGYLARQDGIPNGNAGQYEISLSNDGQTFTQITTGTFVNTMQLQTVVFPVPTYARFVKFRVLNSVPESALNGDSTALVAAEIKLYKYNGTTFSVRPGEPWLASATHDGACTVGYRLYANDVVISTVPVANLINGMIQLPGSLKELGYYQIKVSAYTANMCGITSDEKFSETVALVVENTLSTPGLPQISKGPFGPTPVPTPPPVDPNAPVTTAKPTVQPQPKPRVFQIPPARK